MENILLIVLFLVAVVYAIPVLFGNQPAIQVSNATAGMDVSQAVLQTGDLCA